MKKQLIGLALFSSLTLWSCQNTISDSIPSYEQEQISVHFGLKEVRGFARSVYPTLDTELSSYAFTLEATTSGETSTLLTDVSYSELTTPLNLKKGEYDFKLSANKQGTLYEGFATGINLSANNSEVAFNMVLVENHYEGTGSLKVTVSVTDDESKISSIKAFIDDTEFEVSYTDGKVVLMRDFLAGIHDVVIKFYDADNNLLASVYDENHEWIILGGKITSIDSTLNISSDPAVANVVLTVNNPEWESSDLVAFTVQDLSSATLEELSAYASQVSDKTTSFQLWIDQYSALAKALTADKANPSTVLPILDKAVNGRSLNTTQRAQVAKITHDCLDVVGTVENWKPLIHALMKYPYMINANANTNHAYTNYTYTYAKWTDADELVIYKITEDDIPSIPEGNTFDWDQFQGQDIMAKLVYASYEPSNYSGFSSKFWMGTNKNTAAYCRDNNFIPSDYNYNNRMYPIWCLFEDANGELVSLSARLCDSRLYTVYGGKDTEVWWYQDNSKEWADRNILNWAGKYKEPTNIQIDTSMLEGDDALVTQSVYTGYVVPGTYQSTNTSGATSKLILTQETLNWNGSEYKILDGAQWSTFSNGGINQFAYLIQDADGDNYLCCVMYYVNNSKDYVKFYAPAYADISSCPTESDFGLVGSLSKALTDSRYLSWEVTFTNPDTSGTVKVERSSGVDGQFKVTTSETSWDVDFQTWVKNMDLSMPDGDIRAENHVDVALWLSSSKTSPNLLGAEGGYSLEYGFPLTEGKTYFYELQCVESNGEYSLSVTSAQLAWDEELDGGDGDYCFTYTVVESVSLTKDEFDSLMIHFN